MATTLRYFLGKESRLKSRKAIDALFATGRSFHVYPVKITWHTIAGSGKVLAGVSVSKKRFKHATDRNRIKRMLREAYRLEQQEILGVANLLQRDLDIFIHYTGNALPDFLPLKQAVRQALQKLGKNIDAQP